MSANTFQPRKQNAPVLRGLSILLYGVPKVGKTTEAAKFPGALLLNCEPSGTDLLKGEHDVYDVTSLQQLDSFVAQLANTQYKTVVLDGFTWLINQAVSEEIKRRGKQHSLPIYGEVTDNVKRILGDILRSGKIVVATGHSRLVDVEGEAKDKVEVRPDINPRLSDGVFGLFSIIAYCYPTADGSKMLTKPQDNDKRRIVAGDRSGVLPTVMPLSADKLMEFMRQTQPAKQNGDGNGEKVTEPA
jgi:hypothetical protein